MRAPSITFASVLQDFFLLRLKTERGASPRTIASYRDTFELLLRFVEQNTGQPPSRLTLGDFDAPLVLDFLDHLEKERRNSPQTRNVRLAAIPHVRWSHRWFAEPSDRVPEVLSF